jgi:membrane-associated protease RseP (regulator of RpoE activity)
MFSKPIPKLILHIVLFLLTIITTSLAGAEWMGLPVKSLQEAIISGLNYAFPFLLILTVHEFGHFFTARYYHVPVSLPYFIPMYFFGVAESIGTMGAFIKMQPAFTTTRQYFDIGVAGPLAGLVVAFGFLIYGFSHLPAKTYIFQVHPEYKVFGLDYEKHVYSQKFMRFSDSLHHVQLVQNGLIKTEFQPREHYETMAIGDNLLFYLIKNYFVEDKTLVPNKYELMHYPILFASFLALFFTSLNLIPIGQLDGGHVIYGLFGYDKHKIISRLFFVAFVFYACLGFVDFYVSEDELIKSIVILAFILWFLFRPLFSEWKSVALLALSVLAIELLLSTLFPNVKGYIGWVVYAGILSRVVGVTHPVANVEMPLSSGRKILGWLTLLMFILCFTPQPFIVE